ncbi:helix-turn-helix domain-containing protein [Streptomyces sp. NPDC091292]|uniref:helix-turn-helix domain-containing protein n=1 Tax=Streptomyces sp. NPDC091292 TaxID=3365991 RepID=UPI00380A63F8
MTNLSAVGRVARYRQRRGMSQEVMAGLVGRTVDWPSKAENNRLELDRLPIIKSLADALDVTLGDLLAEPTLTGWTADSGNRTVPALRSALTRSSLNGSKDPSGQARNRMLGDFVGAQERDALQAAPIYLEHGRQPDSIAA